MSTTLAASNVTATTTTLVAWWTSEDKQGSFDCGGLPACEALDMLLDQCGEDHQRADILSGSFDLAAGDDDDSGDEAEVVAVAFRDIAWSASILAIGEDTCLDRADSVLFAVTAAGPDGQVIGDGEALLVGVGDDDDLATYGDSLDTWADDALQEFLATCEDRAYEINALTYACQQAWADHEAAERAAWRAACDA